MFQNQHTPTNKSKNLSVTKQWQRLIYPMKRKVGRPRGSGPAQLIRAVLLEQYYLAVKELEQHGTPLAGLKVLEAKQCRSEVWKLI